MASMPRKRDFDLQAKGLGLSSFCPDTWQKGGSGPMKTVWAHGLGADEALGWEGETQTDCAGSPSLGDWTRHFTSVGPDSLTCTWEVLPGPIVFTLALFTEILI